MNSKIKKLKLQIKELEIEIDKRPAKPLYGEARSLLLKAMDNSACVNDAIKNYNKLKKKIEKLKDLLGELYDEAAYEKAGVWVIDNKELQNRVEQILKERKIMNNEFKINDLIEADKDDSETRCPVSGAANCHECDETQIEKCNG